MWWWVYERAHVCVYYDVRCSREDEREKKYNRRQINVNGAAAAAGDRRPFQYNDHWWSSSLAGLIRFIFVHTCIIITHLGHNNVYICAY